MKKEITLNIMFCVHIFPSLKPLIKIKVSHIVLYNSRFHGPSLQECENKQNSGKGNFLIKIIYRQLT